MKKLVSFVLALVLFLGVAPFRVNAKSVSKTSSITSATVSGSGMYIVKNSTPLRSSTGKLYSKYATLQKGAMVAVSGSSGNFYKVNMNGTSYYVSKTDLSKASEKVKANLYYTIKEAVLRATPYETGSKISTIAKGNVFAVVGMVKNSHSNTWLMVWYKDAIYYLYSENAKAVSKITLAMTGEDMLAVGKTTTLKYTVTPSAVKATFTSSDTKVAKVDISGKITGVGPGTATITAKVGDYLKVSYTITVFEYAIFPASTLNITQVAFGKYSHGKQNAVDFTTTSRIVAPFTGKIVKIDPKWGYVVLQSTHKVMFADGSFEYMTIGLMHDSDLSGLYVGKVIKQGTPFYDQGGQGKDGPNSYGAHVHMCVWRGKSDGKVYGAGNMFVFDALFIDRSFTKKIGNYGKCAKDAVVNNAPNDYKKLWRYLN